MPYEAPRPFASRGSCPTCFSEVTALDEGEGAVKDKRKPRLGWGEDRLDKVKATGVADRLGELAGKGGVGWKYKDSVLAVLY